MKKSLLTLQLCLFFFISSTAQNYFEIADEHYEKQDYAKADSFYLLYLNQYPTDTNALFNYGLTKLRRKDTCAFGNVMLELCNQYANDYSCNLYYSICGRRDTTYYENNFKISNDSRARYTEILETHKCINYQTVVIHDKKNETASLRLTPGLPKVSASDIVAICNIYPNGDTLFTYTVIPPKFPGPDGAKTYFLNENKYIEAAKNELNISQMIADITYIVDENGRVSNLTLISTNKEVQDTEKLKEYIKLIFSKMPKHEAARFRGKKVRYLVKDFIAFW